MARVNILTLVFGLALVASVALNGHMCKRVGEVEERERGKDEVIAELRKEPEWVNKVTVRHESERADIEAVRKAARQGVRDELRTNPVFKAWAGNMLPSSVSSGGGLLGASSPGNNQAQAPGDAVVGTKTP